MSGKGSVFGKQHRPLGEINAMHRTKPGDVPIDIDPDHVRVRPQIRTVFEEGSLEELVADIQALGQHTPAVVIPDPEASGKYVMVAGERRLRAVKALGIKLRAFVRDLNEQQVDAFQFSENVQRANLTQMELGAKLAADYDALKGTTSKVLEAVAELRRMSVPTVSEYINYYRAATGQGVAAKAVEQGVTSDRQVVIGLGKLEKESPELAAKALEVLSEGSGQANQRNVVKEFREQARVPAGKKSAETKASQQSGVVPSAVPKAGSASDYLTTLHQLVVNSRRAPKTAIESVGADGAEKARKALLRHFKAGRSAASEANLGQLILTRFAEGVFAVDGEGAMNLLAYVEGMTGAAELDLQNLLTKAKK